MFSGEGLENASVPWLGIGFHDVEPGTLAVQGRELPTLRFRTQRPDEAAKPADESGKPGWLERWKTEVETEVAKAAVNVDVTPDPPGELLVLIQYSTPGKLERIADEELVAFLAHFDLGGD
jgi:hypothetical protein